MKDPTNLLAAVSFLERPSPLSIGIQGQSAHPNLRHFQFSLGPRFDLWSIDSPFSMLDFARLYQSISLPFD